MSYYPKESTTGALSQVSIRLCVFVSFVFVLSSFALSSSASARSLDAGINAYQRIAGSPPSAEEITKIAPLAAVGDFESIAYMAMKNKSFYRSTLKYMASSMSNTTQLPSIDLNDFSATIIGVFRDSVPLTSILYDDILYVGNKTALANISPFNAGAALANYSDANNNHYRQLDVYGVDLSDPNLFVRTKQSQVDSIMTDESAMGVMTTRTAGEAFFSDGTNRRPLAFAMSNFLCREMEQLHDITTADFRVRQDVPRDAGGDSSTYITKCAGCHAGMDALAGAFAYYDYISVRNNDGSDSKRVVYYPTPANKYFRNKSTYEDGYQTKDDSWINLWTIGQNASLGWRPTDNGEPTEGVGAKELGKVLAASRGFSECMAQRVYSQVCSRSSPFEDVEKEYFKQMASALEEANYNGKVLFAKSVGYCAGN